MKSINVKKLAALAVGAMFVGQAYAAGLAADTLPTDKTWYLNSAIVIGANAKPADVVWAGNIAAAIGQMAFEAKTETKTADLSNATVKLSIPGEIVVGGQGVRETYTFNPANPEIDGTTNKIVVTGTDLPSLKDSQKVTYKLKEGGEWKDKDAYVSETIKVDWFDAKGYVPEGSQKAELVAYTKQEKVSFVVDLTGLDLGVSGDDANTTVDSEAFKGITLDILGKSYKLSSVTFDNEGDDSTSDADKVTLTVYEKEDTLAVGEEADLGNGYKLKLVDVDPDNKAAYVELYKDGTKVADDVLDLSEHSSTDFDGELSDEITLETVFAGTETKFAKFQLAKKTIELTEGGSGEKDEPTEGWVLKANDIQPDKIELVVSYKGDEDQTYLKTSTGLKPGDVMWFPDHKYGVAFEGFESKPVKVLSIDGDSVVAYDEDGRKHTLSLYGETTITLGTTATIYDIIDSKDLDIEIPSSLSDGAELDYDKDLDGEVESGEKTTLNGINLEGNTSTYEAYYADLKIDVDNDNSPEFQYRIYLVGDKMYHVLGTTDPNNAKPSDKMPYYIKTDFDDDDSDQNVGVRKISIYEPKLDGSDWSSTAFVITPKTKNVSGTGTVNVIDKLDFEDTDVTYDTAKFDFDSDSDDPVNGVTPWGTEFEITGTSKIDFRVPTEQRKLKFFVGEPAQTVEAGQSFEVPVGGETDIGGTPIKIEGINAEGVSVTYTTYEPMKDWNPEIVYLDTKLPNTYDKVIVVGGYYVNSVAKMLAEKFSELYDVDTEGEWIVKKFDADGKEYIVVFGYTADDTGAAAHEFISWLRENVA